MSQVKQSVLTALAWLTSSNVTDAVENALTDGLISGDLKSNWQVDEKRYLCLLELKKNSLPRRSQLSKLSKLMVGLGEMNARSHASYSNSLLDTFSDKKYIKILADIIEKAEGIYEKSGYKVEIVEEQLSSSIGLAGLDINGAKLVGSLVARPNIISFPPRYGVDELVKFLLFLDDKTFCRWFSSSRSKGLYAYSIALVELFLFGGNKELALSVLRGECGFLKLLIVACTVNRHLEGDARWTISGLIDFLVKNNTSIGSSIWIAVRFLPVGGKEEIENYAEGLASFWPIEGLSDVEFKTFVAVLMMNRQELKCRLAMKIPAKVDAKRLFEDNIFDLKKYLGMEKKDDITSEYLLFQDREDQLIYWSSYSFVELCKQNNIKYFNKIRNTFGNLTRDLESFLGAPYIAVRQSGKWMTATFKLAVIHYFVLLVYSHIGDSKGEYEKIVNEAVSHTTLLFNKIFESGGDTEAIIFDKLSLLCAIFVVKTPSLSDKAEAVISDASLPEYFKALVLWGSPALLAKNLQLGRSLFLSVAEPPLSRSEYDRSFNRLLNLLDTAVANTSDDNHKESIQDIWEVSYSKWKFYLGDTWQNIASYLLLAMEGDEQAMNKLQKFNGMENSQCVNHI